MKEILLGLLIRYAKGERYKDVAPMEIRCQLAIFAFFPIFIGSFIWVAHTFLHGTGLVALGLSALACLLFACLAAFGWAMLMPLKASMIASVILWILLIWVVAHLDFTKFGA
jgi:hypothetical protein